MKLKKYFLIFSSITVVVIALGYGFSPQWFANTFLGVNNLDINFAHILRAVMGLYIAFGLYWFFSAFSDEHRNGAMLTTILFVGGLFAGRLISLLFEGQPSALLSLYTLIELVFLPVAYWVYRHPD